MELPEIKFKGVALNDVLDFLYDRADLEYTVLSNTVVVRKKKEEPAKEQTKAQQERRVTGTVKDENGETLPGVTVVSSTLTLL